MKNRYIQIFSFLIALLSFATFPACELDDKINFVTEGGINDVDTGYVSLIDITDNTDADWKTLPAGYVASATHSNGCSLNGLKSVKVYSDQKYLNILVEVNLEVVTDRAWTPFHVFLNADGSDATGGYGDIFTDANTDIMLETAIYAEGHAQYNPAVFKWWGEVGGFGWIWTNPNIASVADNCWGAIVCEGSYPAVGYAQSVNADRSRIEIQILKEHIPTQWANEFTIGFGIQQSWTDVGVLPNAPDENGKRVFANKLKVKTYMPHNTATYENGHEYVDLGLSVKWATMNVGASKAEDYGGYFAWGETTTKSTYNWSTYKWCNGSKTTLTKYNMDSSYGTVDNKMQLDLSDDAARANWGGAWRMPTNAEWTELCEQCTWTWTTQNGVKGYKVKSKNGNFIFLPAAGDRAGSSLYDAGSDGYYWSSALHADYQIFARCVTFASSDVDWLDNNRYLGQSVRPVLGENESVQTTAPAVTTAAITQITETSAVAGGNVTSDGGASVTERGVVYATIQNPTTNNTKVTSGTGSGSFTCNLTDLQPNTTYYVRAYATNEVGTAYGEEVSFTTLVPIVLPTLTTSSVTQITETSAVAGGNVTSDGGASVTERGVVYATIQNPTTNNTKVTSGTGSGSFTCNLTDLQPNTIYYVRAYAINEVGTAYGEEVSFTTNEEMVDNPPSNLVAMPFSVSAGKQVTFSQGNLQYTQSTNTWSFAESQLDIIGTDNVTGGSVLSDPTDGDSKSGTALADKIDLFGLSTSANNFGVSTSTDSNDYFGSFVDWGTNKIDNDAPNTWRTLTYGEWDYLRYTRTNADALCGIAQVNGVNGLVLLPDNWTCPEGATFKSGFHSNHGVDYYAAHQTFTADQWSKLEAAGAVFLPAAGGRYGSDVYCVQEGGRYWSASELDSYHAGYLFFSLGEANLFDGNRSGGLSVRLVKDL